MTAADTSAAIQALMAQFAIFEALLLAASAVHKAVRWPQSRQVVRRFAGIPAALAAPALAAVILAEVSAALLLGVAATRAAGALVAALLLGCYLVLIVRAIVQNRRDVDCGCSFGPARPLGAFQVARNGLLFAGTLLLAAVSVSSGSAPPQASQVLGGLALLALYGALDEVMAVRPLRGGVVS
jgi:uncharacterized membrane protein YphA (DoxX/SURF4 family)